MCAAEPPKLHCIFSVRALNCPGFQEKHIEDRKCVKVIGETFH